MICPDGLLLKSKGVCCDPLCMMPFMTGSCIWLSVKKNPGYLAARHLQSTWNRWHNNIFQMWPNTKFHFLILNTRQWLPLCIQYCAICTLSRYISPPQYQKHLMFLILCDRSERYIHYTNYISFSSLIILKTDPEFYFFQQQLKCSLVPVSLLYLAKLKKLKYLLRET